MGEISLWQASFNAGEVTGLLEGREDIAKYPSACRRMRNMNGLIQGPARRRTGTRAVTVTKANGNAWLVPFIRQRRLAYMLEFGDNYVRFYRNRGQLEASPGVAYEIVSPWTYAELTDTDGSFIPRLVQSNDILYICQGVGIKQLNRFSDLDWTITDWVGIGGPFDAENLTPVTVYASAQTGVVTLTASDAIFTSDRIGSLFRIAPQDLRNIPPWEPNTVVSSGVERRSDGKTYRQMTVGVTENTDAQRHTGTVAPIHEDGTAKDGGNGGRILDTFDNTNTVETGYDWEFRDPGYGVLTIDSVATGFGGIDAAAKVVLHLDGADASTVITDATAFSTWTAAGNAQLDNVQQKFGATSALFDGTGDYLTSATGGLELTNQDFTIDFWFRANHAGAGVLRGMVSKMTNFTAATHSFSVMINASNFVEFSLSNGTTRTVLPGTTVFNNVTNVGWHHCAAVRRGNLMLLFVDGILEASTPFTGTVPTLAEAYLIGANTELADFFTGWIDEFRLSIGVARWTTNFTPPALPYDAAFRTATATVSKWRTGSNAQLPLEVVLVGKATTRWSWGLFSDANGWPRAPSFFRERFVLAGSRLMAFSTSNDFGDFSQETAGQTLADNAFVVNIASDRDEDLLWVMPSKQVLHVGTTGGEHAIQEQNVNAAFGPLNRKIEPQTSYGSNGATPIRIGDKPFFVEASGLRVRAIEPSADGGLDANSQNDLAEHITRSTVIQTAYAAQPDSLYWGMRVDGRLACLTYSKPQEVFAWSLHYVGGWRDASRTQPAKVRSVAVIPNPEGTLDDTWMIAERLVNGSVVRFVEFLTENNSAPEQYENESADEWGRRIQDFQADAFFVDGGITYDAPITITGATLVGGKVRIAAPAHGLSDGDSVRVDQVVGTWKVNARIWTLSGVTAGTFDLDETTAADFNTYVSGGKARLLVTTISGLGAWEGETLQVLADGAVHPDRTVSGGSIELQIPSGRVQIGWGYKSLLETQRPAGGNERGSAQGQLGAINEITIRLHQSLGGRVGPDEDHLDDILFRSASDFMDLPPPLFSGDKSMGWPDGFSTDRTVVFVQDQPLPAVVVGFGSDMEVNVT